ncbi:hypothetical protein CVV38_03780 [Candidatus Peregrinibacteria bacterium HGW-Peregrinibacteria-1]|jgi:riboflavin kinase/FMN adenylyltransferase|nr:MAG: hypothetical protein CVV38_03780 [Candidatus Peregrinibacteria bacterium HGW-Peregrinibacteria-1]
MEIIRGAVVTGQKLGRKMGFPTININYNGMNEGVFAGMVAFNGAFFPAAVHVGPRPTINDDRKICEAFLLDFDGSIPEEVEVEVRLIEKIREVKKFDTLEDLRHQIGIDVDLIRSILA